MYMKIPYYNLSGKRLSGKVTVRESDCSGNVCKAIKQPSNGEIRVCDEVIQEDQTSVDDSNREQLSEMTSKLVQVHRQWRYTLLHLTTGFLVHLGCSPAHFYLLHSKLIYHT